MQSLSSIVSATLFGKYHPKRDCSKRGWVRRNFRGRGGRSKRSDLQCKRCGNTGHTSDQCWASWDSIKDKHNQKKDDQDASKASDSCIVAHCNLGFNEMTSLSSYKDCWLLILLSQGNSIIILMQMPIFLQIIWRLGFTFRPALSASYYLFILQ